MAAPAADIPDVAAWKRAVAEFDERFTALVKDVARRDEPPELDDERDSLSVWLNSFTHEEQIKAFCEIVPHTLDGHLLMRMLILITGGTPHARGLVIFLNSLIGSRLVRRAEMGDLHGEKWMKIPGSDPYLHANFKDAMLAAAITSQVEAKQRV